MAGLYIQFKREVWSYYHAHRRSMPWRYLPALPRRQAGGRHGNITPYRVVVSEIMLQQTQVPRVILKFNSFIKRFPDWQSLAKASTRNALKEWSGLGYNRRALYLKRIAEKVINDPKYNFLKSPFLKGTSGRILIQDLHSLLMALPGIGPNTAGSILAFAYNIPYPFIETNIRSVFIHFFFKNSKRKVNDHKIFPLIEKTLDTKNPREWYYALMDYGAYLKKENANPSRKSAHHIKQSPFKGSNRELRSKILKLVMKKPATFVVIKKSLKEYESEQIQKNLQSLVKEGFLKREKMKYRT